MTKWKCSAVFLFPLIRVINSETSGKHLNLNLRKCLNRIFASENANAVASILLWRATTTQTTVTELPRVKLETVRILWHLKTTKRKWRTTPPLRFTTNITKDIPPELRPILYLKKISKNGSTRLWLREMSVWIESWQRKTLSLGWRVVSQIGTESIDLIIYIFVNKHSLFTTYPFYTHLKYKSFFEEDYANTIDFKVLFMIK